MSRKKTILKDAGIYTIASYAAQFFDIINGVLIRRFLGPANMGVWAFLQVIINYAKHAGLGITTATSRDVPYYLGKGEKEKAEEIQNLVFSFTLSTAFLTGLGIFAYAFFSRGKHSTPIIIGLCVVSVVIILQRLFNLNVVILRSHKRFGLAGFLNLFTSVLSVFFTLTLTYFFKLYGFFASQILIYVGALFFIRWQAGPRFSLVFSRKKLSPLFDLGFAMLVADVLRTLLMSMDRIFLTKFMGFTSLGVYSVALMANNYLYSLPNMLGIIFFPHFQEVFAERDNPRDLLLFLNKPVVTLCYLLPVLIGAAWLLSTFAIPLLLPDYVSGIPALKLLVLGSFFMALTHPFSAYIITVRKHWHFIPILAVLVLIAGLSFGVATMHFGTLEAVAIAGIIVALVHYILLSTYCYLHLKGLAEMLGVIIRAGTVFIYFAGILCLLDAPYNTSVEAGRLGLNFLLYAAAMTPLIFLAERKVGLFSTLKDLFHSFIKKRKQKD